MSGHSKWANIKHKKQAQDAKRGKVFSKLSKEIIVAARTGGGDEQYNPRLRTIILKARQTNMPKDNIEKAIKRGTGDLDGVSYEEVIYEAYAPGGVAILIEVLTDKKSRTLPEIKTLLNKNGGTFAEAGSVGYLFKQLGVFVIESLDETSEDKKEEKLLQLTLDIGAEDFKKEHNNIYIIYTPKENFHACLDKITPIIENDDKISLIESSLQYVADIKVELDESKSQTILNLVDTLEQHDDVQNVFYNLG